MIRLKSDEPAPVVGLQLMVVISLEEAIEDFVIDRQSRRLSPRTLSYYRDELGLFSRWMEAPHPAAGNAGQQIALDGVRATDLRRWLLDLSERRNPGGVHASFRALRAFFGWAWVEYEYTTHNPMAKVAPPRVLHALQPQRVRWLPVCTLRLLVAACLQVEGGGGRRRLALLAFAEPRCDRRHKRRASPLPWRCAQQRVPRLPRRTGGGSHASMLLVP